MTRARVARVVLADHPVLRGGLRVVLGAQSDLAVVGEAGGGPGAVAAAVRAAAGVVLLDLTMPGGGVMALGRREREVLVRGHTHQAIADRLGVNVKTVETYRARIRDKTGLKTRADLVRGRGRLLAGDGATRDG